MTDMTNAPTHRVVNRKRGLEFQIYFSLIFILALPVGTERWIASVVRKRSLDTRGPLARAWADADRITPLIFSA
ncbi:MAG: cytochrome PufQ [Pseudomonadota bacterium]